MTSNPRLEKGIETLINISMKMERSLAAMSAKNTGPGSNGPGIMGAISGGISNMMGTLASKPLTKEQGQVVVSTLKGISSVVNTTSLEKAKAFSSAMSYTAEGLVKLSDLVTLRNAIKFKIGSSLMTDTIKKFVDKIQYIYKDVTDPDKLKQQGEAIKSLAVGLKALSSMATRFMLFAVAAPLIAVGALVMRGVLAIFTFAGESYKKIKGGGDALAEMGRGLMLFTGGFASFMLVLAVAGTARVLGSAIVLSAITLAFVGIGKLATYIKGGGEAIKEMGIGLMFFSGALFVMSLAMQEITFGGVMANFGVLTLYTTTFFLIGKGSREIEKGARSITMVSAAIASVGLALFLFDLTTKKIGLFEGGKGLLILSVFGGLALGFSMLGKASADIFKGAISVAMMSASLAVLGLGLFLFAFSLKQTTAIIGGNMLEFGKTFGVLILGVTAAFSLLGLAAPIIAPGLAVATGIGGGLAILGLGMLGFAISVKGLNALDAIDKNGNLRGASLIENVVSMFANISLMGILAIPGIAVGLAAGAALLSISVGLIAFGYVSKKLEEIKAYDSSGKLKATSVVSDLISMFAGVALDSVFAIPGIAVTLGMGVSLLSIAWGLSKASEVFSSLELGSDGKTFKVAEQLDNVVSGLFNTFKNIADLTSGSNLATGFGGFIKNLTGTDPITMGIKAVDGIGDAIRSIAGGISSFSDLQSFVMSDGSKIDLKTASGNIGIAISTIFNAMSVTLSEIGKTAGGSGFLGSLTNLIGQDPISVGLRVLKELGGALRSVVGGVAAFGNFSEFPIDKVVNGAIIKDKVDLWVVAKNFKTNLPNLFKYLSEGFTALNLDAFEDDDKLELMDQVAKGFSSLFTSINKINALNIDVKKLDSLRTLGDIVKGLTESGKGFASFVNPFMHFANAFEKFTRYIPMYGNNIKFSQMFADQFTGFAANGTGMYNFARGFHTVAMKMSDFATNFKKMDKDTINSFKSWTETFDTFLKVDTKKFSMLVKQVGEFYEPINKSFTVEKNDQASKQSYNQQFEAFKAPVQYPVYQKQEQVSIDLNPLLAQIAGLSREIQALNHKFVTGMNGGLLVSNV